MKINEVTDPRSTTLQHSIDEYIALIEDKCSKALVYFQAGKAAYKGLRSHNKFGGPISLDDVMKTDPKLIERKSKNTSNYYTMLLDNLQAWKKYPKRSRSLICTTSRRHAYNYGSAYLVLPFDGAKFGVCPKDDFWYSFPNVQKLAREFGDMADFNSTLKSLDLPDNNFTEFISRFLPSISSTDGSNYTVNAIHDYFSKANKDADVIKLFNSLLDPKTNGFKLTTVGNWPEEDDPSKEVWTDSECYMIACDSDLYFKLKELYRSRK
jgi:hypothetical protein